MTKFIQETEFKFYDVPKQNLKLKGVQQFLIKAVNLKDKVAVLSELMDHLGDSQTMIFVNTKATADKVEKLITQKGYSFTKLYGGMENFDRDKAIDNFRSGDTRVLISTNVLARGIDVPEVDLVVNFDCPYDYAHGAKFPDFANYLHRIGRTGRFGTDGLALTMYSDEVEYGLMKEVE